VARNCRQKIGSRNSAGFLYFFSSFSRPRHLFGLITIVVIFFWLGPFLSPPPLTSLPSLSGWPEETGLASDPTLSEKVIIDSLRRKVRLPSQVRRLLSLQPEITRIIVALGGGDHLVGLDRFLRFEDHLFSLIYPSASELPLVALSDENVNAEVVLRFQPDVVFVSPSEPSLAEALSRQLSIPVVALASLGRFDLLQEEIRLVGQAIGRKGRAEELEAYFQTKLAWLKTLLAEKEKVSKPRVYLAFWSSLVMTPVSYDPVKIAGGLNLAEGLIPSYLGTARTVVNLEQIIAWNPEIILIHGNYPPAERQVTIETIAADRRLSTLEAVKKGRIYYTFGFWYWWDPAEALFETIYLTSLFHPELRSKINLKKQGEEIFTKFYDSAEAFPALLKMLQINLPDSEGQNVPLPHLERMGRQGQRNYVSAEFEKEGK